MKQVQPRISMISCLSSTGSIFLTLVQANSNSAMMELYFTALIKLLDKKQANWRQKFLIVQDNA